ncbi:uncharacterized protein IWZ02DRAFT_134162 [Phyllosticta citriasiana]|uniref:Uncharacterized protein n=1 Tax=Phyllosticta citriasiana TaxID=595635 RepID=A0ABR1KUI4_9PEZI
MCLESCVQELRWLFRHLIPGTAFDFAEDASLDPLQAQEPRNQKRVFRMCSHLELDCSQMCAMEDYGTGVSCKSCHPKGASNHARNNLKRMGRWFVHVNEAKLPGVSSFIELSIQRIHGRLAADTTQICPHVRFCDLDMERVKSKHATLEVDSWRTIKTAVHGECKTKFCGTKFSFEWKRDYSAGRERHTVDFKIHREFKLDGADGPVWRANTDNVVLEEEDEEEEEGEKEEPAERDGSEDVSAELEESWEDVEFWPPRGDLA